jgi:hypothetical protein
MDVNGYLVLWFPHEYSVYFSYTHADDDYDNIAEFLERFLGRLTAQQKNVLRTASQSLKRFDVAWLDDRRQWLENLQPLLAREEGWQEAVMNLYRARKQNRSPTYTESQEHNLTIISQAVAEVIGMMNERQKQHAVEEIEDLRIKLGKLIEARQEQAYRPWPSGLRVAS